MNHAFGVGAVERAADLLHHRDCVLRARISSRLRMVRRSSPVDVFHADEANALRLAQIVNADHILVRDVTGENQLLLEAGEDCGIGGQLRTDDFSAIRRSSSRSRALYTAPIPPWPRTPRIS